MSQPTPEQVINRKLTHWFIMQDPTQVTLIPTEKIRQPGGGFRFVEGTPRVAQTMKLIHQGMVDRGQATEDGQVRKYEFVLLAEWDAIIEIGDLWRDDKGNTWVVKGFTPNNGYEIKAGVTAYGSKPDGG